MYNDIGGKIKGLAKGIFVVESILTMFSGVAFLLIDEDTVLIGILVFILGPVIAWISSWFTYGFGELIDKTSEIARNNYSGERKSEAQSKIEYERIKKIEQLRSNGLISEEEYQQAISKEQ